MMEAPPKTVLKMTVSFDMDVEFNSFQGRSLHQFVSLIENDLYDVVQEMRPEIYEVYNLKTTVEND